MGEFYKEAMESLGEALARINQLGEGAAVNESLLRVLGDHEKRVGEEYLMGMLAKILSTAPSGAGGHLKLLLDLIAEDEDRHAKLLERLLKKEESRG